jgi:diguanylate cyclase (GGDEF)-like protein
MPPRQESTDSTLGVPVRRPLVLLCVPPEIEAGLSVNGTVAMSTIPTSDPVNAVQIALKENAAILVHLGAGDDKLRRLAIARASQTVPPILITCGTEGPGARRIGALDAAAHLSDSPDPAYLRGVLDGAQLTSEGRRVRSATQVMRIQMLYELSSRLLRTMQRAQLSSVLGHTLPRLLEVPLIIVVLPKTSTPVPYVHAPNGIAPAAVDVLKEHLRRAWEVLAPEEGPVSWDHLDELPPADAGGVIDVTPDSFVTAPITRGNQTCGFFTVLPDAGWGEDEPRMQTFFVVGDLLGVVMHNFDLLEQLEMRATHDGLTSVLNRQTLMDRLEAECQRTRRYELQVSVLVMDLDHFKKVNDTFGHQAGDSVLRAFTRVLTQAVRDVDIVGRAGGEEFVAILPQTGLHGASQVAERIRSGTSELRIPVGRSSIGVTVSIGVASAIGEDAQVTALIAKADAALYRAKSAGRNRVELDRLRPKHDITNMDPEESIDLF